MNTVVKIGKMQRCDALVLTVWQSFDVGFVPTVALRLDAAEIADVRDADLSGGMVFSAAGVATAAVALRTPALAQR